MTGWWTAMADWGLQDPTDPVVTVWAYSVRPDLWPPGSVVPWYTGVPGAGAAPLAEWHWTDHTAQVMAWADRAEALGFGGPGVAEAMILADLVRLSPTLAPVTHWDPCPRPEGSQ